VRAKTNVNLRTGPGTNYSILATVVSGTNGTVTGYPVVAGSYTWYPVAMNGYPAGYLAGAYLTKTGSGPTVTATRTVAPPTVTRTATTITGGFPVGAAVQVNTGSLNLRSGPGTTYTSLGLMPRGTTGTVTGAPEAVGSSLWYPVNMTGFGNGWVSGQYLTNAIVTAEDLTETPVPTDVPVTVEPTATEAIAVPTDVPEPTATDSVVAPTDVPEPTATDSVVVPPTETTAAEEPPIEEPPGEGTPSE